MVQPCLICVYLKGKMFFHKIEKKVFIQPAITRSAAVTEYGVAAL